MSHLTIKMESERAKEEKEEEDDWVGEQEGVDTVEDAAMAGNPVSRVFGAVEALYL